MAGKKTTTKGSRKPPRQKPLPTMERKVDKEISTAAEDLYEVRATRMDWTKKEKAAEGRLIEILERKKVETYVDPELEIRVILKPGKTKVSVTRVKDEGDAGDDDASDKAAE